MRHVIRLWWCEIIDWISDESGALIVGACAGSSVYSLVLATHHPGVGIGAGIATGIAVYLWRRHAL